jgi:hypothetical protein
VNRRLFLHILSLASAFAGCAQGHHHVGSGYATSTTNPITSFLISISWNRELTFADTTTAATAFVAVLAVILAWGQLRRLSRQTRADVLLAMDER